MEHIGPARLRALLDAVLVIASDLDLPTVLGRIVASAADLADARYAALGVLDEAGTGLDDFLTIGIDNDTKTKIGPLPKGHGILGELIVDPKPLRLPNIAEHPSSYGFPPNHPPMTSFLGVPIRLHNKVFGNLYLTDKRSAEVFSDIDEEVVVTLAAAAAIAIENARLHEQVAKLTLIEERDRIAKDLHDTVIQRLFAAGLVLQTTAQLADEDVSTRIGQTVDELDSVVREVRSAIFKLESPNASPSAQEAIGEVAAEASRMLGFDVAVTLDSKLDDVDLPPQVFHALLSTLRESLSIIARHAHASSATIELQVDDPDVVLRVQDNGVGIDLQAGLGGRGIANANDRASRLGGAFSIATRSTGGTAVEWRAPLKPE